MPRRLEIRLGVDLKRTETEPALREFVDATLPEGVRQALHVRMEVRVGDTSEAILQTARRLKAGLIVMGTHGRSGFAHMVLGSVAERVVRTAPCAVLTVRESSRTADVVAEAVGHVFP